jgi:hypothetical protein
MIALLMALSVASSPCLKGSILRQGKAVELLYCNASSKVYTVKQGINLDAYPIKAKDHLTCQCIK